MLILTRFIGQRIIISDDIEVTFLGMDRSFRRAKLGIYAPDSIEIYREEIHQRVVSERIKNQNVAITYKKRI